MRIGNFGCRGTISRQPRLLCTTVVLLATASTGGCAIAEREVKRPGLAEVSASEPLAASADMIITDKLVAEPRTYEQFQFEPISVSLCIGEQLRIANVSRTTIGLVDTPEESDNALTLGIVRPNGVFTFKPNEVGTFIISAAGQDGLLFHYNVREC